ncbi:MAG: beta-phosphoglucomutase family hydrolase [Frankiaceae bacterium]|nr:beta-phosphoglucomutase family hydrolase [Frankiaceae bacterium]
MITPLGLPDGVRLCLFDLDGVLTDTAAVHTVAWKAMFDAFLRARDPAGRPFDAGEDYRRYVDGKPRADGVRTFLQSRGITLPEGHLDDGPDVESVHGLGRRKNDLLLATIERDGVDVFPKSVRYLEAVRAAGLRTAVVSSSANTEQVLEVTGLAPLLELRVDALVAREHGLAGKPAPDTFLYAAEQLGGSPSDAAVFEDARAGVQSGVAGGFAYVVGVDRAGQAAALIQAGAHRVVRELDELLEAS